MLVCVSSCSGSAGRDSLTGFFFFPLVERQADIILPNLVDTLHSLAIEHT